MLNTLRTYLLTSAEHRSPFLLEGPVLLILSSHQFSLRHNGFPLNKMASTTSQCCPRPRAYRRAEDASSWAWSRGSRLLTDLCYVCAAPQLRGLDHTDWLIGTGVRRAVRADPVSSACRMPGSALGTSLLQCGMVSASYAVPPRRESMCSTQDHRAGK